MSTDKGKNNALMNNNSDVEEGEIPDQESLSSAANSKRGKENPKNKVLRSRSASSSSSGSLDSDESKKGWWKKKKLKREGDSGSGHDFNSDDSDDEEIIEQPMTDSNYHKKGWNNKKDFRDKKYQQYNKNKQAHRPNKLGHKKETFDPKFSKKNISHEMPQNDLYPCKYFIAFGKCDNPTCRNIHSPLVREQEIQRFVNENESFFSDLAKRLPELNLPPVLTKVLTEKFNTPQLQPPNNQALRKPMPPPKNIAQPNVYLPPQGPQINNNNFNTFQGQSLSAPPTHIPNQQNIPFNYHPPVQYNSQPPLQGVSNLPQQQPSNFNFNQPQIQPLRHPPQNFAPSAEFLPRNHMGPTINTYLPNKPNFDPNLHNMQSKALPQNHQPYQPPLYNQPPPFQGTPNARLNPGVPPNFAPNYSENQTPIPRNNEFQRQEYPKPTPNLQNEEKLQTPSPVKNEKSIPQPQVPQAEETKADKGAQDQIASFREKMKNFGIFNKTQEEPKVQPVEKPQEESKELSKEDYKNAEAAAIISKFANGSINDQILKQIKGVLPQYQSQSPEDIKNLVNMYLKLSKDPRFSK